MSVSTFFAGCNLVEVNQVEYLNQIVARVGTDTEITKEDLINAYSSYGYQYVESYDMTVEEALEKTLELLVNRKLVVAYARENYTFNQSEINDLFQRSYDYINEQIAEIEADVRSEWSRPAPEEAEEEEAAAENERVFKPYEQLFELVGGRVVKIETDDILDENAAPIGAFVQHISEEDVSAEAYNRYIKKLIESEYGKNLSTVSGEVLQREIERIYEIYEDNEYITKLEEIFNDNLTISDADILARYKELVRADYVKYNNNVSSYITDVKAGNTIYYHPSEEFLYVSHILVPYSEEQKAVLTQAKTDLESGIITQLDYNAIEANLASAISGYVFDAEGNQTETLTSIDDIYAEILASVSAEPTLTLKAEAFNELIYKYNTDSGILNKEFYYTTAIDSANDTMVAVFADASRDLYELDAGILSGRLSAPVLSEYGWHIIFYSRPVTNLVAYSSLESINIEKLFTSRLNEGVNKSWYNLVYDNITAATFETYQNSLIATLRQGVEITVYSKTYKDLID